MKTGIITLYSFMISIFLLFIGITIYGRTEKTKLLNSSLEYSLARALDTLSASGEGRTETDEELANTLYDIFFNEMGQTKDVTLQINDISAEKGLLSATAVWNFKHLNGKTGTITSTKIGVVDVATPVEFAEIEIQISATNDFTEGNYTSIVKTIPLNKPFEVYELLDDDTTKATGDTIVSSELNINLQGEIDGNSIVWELIDAPEDEVKLAISPYGAKYVFLNTMTTSVPDDLLNIEAVDKYLLYSYCASNFEQLTRIYGMEDVEEKNALINEMIEQYNLHAVVTVIDANILKEIYEKVKENRFILANSYIIPENMEKILGTKVFCIRPTAPGRYVFRGYNDRHPY